MRSLKPKSSEVLTAYLKQSGEPPWTSYFVKYSSVQDDQRGLSHFNWLVGKTNYHILRAGCYPYIKYHCSRRPFEDLSTENSIFRMMKMLNLGIPLLAYGIAAKLLISHEEIVHTSKGPVTIYFLYEENKGSHH